MPGDRGATFTRWQELNEVKELQPRKRRTISHGSGQQSESGSERRQLRKFKGTFHARKLCLSQRRQRISASRENWLNVCFEVTSARSLKDIKTRE
jgi:hypothetical protein